MAIKTIITAIRIASEQNKNIDAGDSYLSMFREYKYPSLPAMNNELPLITGDEVIAELKRMHPGL